MDTSFASSLPVNDVFLRFKSGATPGDLLMASMAAEPSRDLVGLEPMTDRLREALLLSEPIFIVRRFSFLKHFSFGLAIHTYGNQYFQSHLCMCVF